MEKEAICLVAVILWIFVILITAVIVFGEDEWPRWRQRPFEWIVDDRFSKISAQILRGYRHRQWLHERSPKARSPPLKTY